MKKVLMILTFVTVALLSVGCMDYDEEGYLEERAEEANDDDLLPDEENGDVEENGLTEVAIESFSYVPDTVII